MESLEGKVVCITGASAGIGAATARLFAKYKSRLALHGRNVERLEKVADECRQIGGLKDEDVLTVTGDIRHDAKKIAQAVTDHFHELYCLVNNAGALVLNGPLSDESLEKVDDMMALHLHGPLELSQLLMGELIKSKGSIVNVSSMAGNLPVTSCSKLGMSKAAMVYMSKCMALELVKRCVRVNVVSPGFTLTNGALAAGFVSTEEESIEFINEKAKAWGAMCAAAPEEIAHPIVFLASEAASYITGQVLTVAGGASLAPTQQNSSHMIQ